MLKKNEEYLVEIIDNGFKGEGIAKIDGAVVFINGAIKGEKVKIKILKVLKNQAYGKIIEILEKSPDRIKEDCETFNKCGGCDLRHIKYEKTLEMKKQNVINILNKNGIETKVNDCIGMKNPTSYRNKLQFPVGVSSDGKAIMGVYAKLSHRIIETKKCIIQNELCNKIANDFFEILISNGVKPYNEETLSGTLRHIYIRIGIKTNEVMVVIVLNKDDISDEEKIVKEITSKYPEIKTIVKNINTQNTNVILGKENKVIFGKGHINDNLLGYNFKISPMSFYQVNPVQTEILYNKAIEYAVGVAVHGNPQKKQTALDLYCGIGTIGICASKYFKKIYGIEIVEEAINDAKENAKINNVDNIEFYAGKVEDLLEKITVKEKTDVVFVDPPRKGLDTKTIEILKDLEPEKIVYVSCNPATLARDLKELKEKYIVKEITPVDMFPYTAHVECVALMGIKQINSK